MRERRDRKVRLVYIAGAAHSGTTLTGSIIGSDSKARYVGEIKQYARRLNKSVPALFTCTCGAAYDVCPFWRTVQAAAPPERDLNPAPGFSWQNLKPVLAALLPNGPGRTAHTLYGDVAAAIGKAAASMDPSVELIVDTSRSIHHLHQAATSNNIDLRVVQVARELPGVVNSNKARGKSAVAAIAGWWVFNTLVEIYLSASRVQVLRVAYADLCDRLPETLDRLNAFLGTDLAPDRLVDEINATEYHLMSGNRGVRKVLGSSEGMDGINRRTGIEHLSRLDRLLVASFAEPFQGLILRRFAIDNQ